MRPLQKGIFLPSALFANAHLLLNKLRFAAELKNKNLRFLHAASSYAKLSSCLYSSLISWPEIAEESVDYRSEGVIRVTSA